MTDWVTATVGSVTQYQRAGGTPSATNPRYYGGDVPFVTIEDITSSTRELHRTERTLTQAGLKASAAWLIPDQHILYSMYATVGKPIVNAIPCATNQAIIALKPNEKIDLEFLYYQLAFIEPDVYKYTSQTTQSNLNASSVRALPIRYPASKDKQRRIAAILTSLDNAIEATEALIEKHQQIKVGLMHDLFTRGVLPSGALRATPDEAPDLYKQSDIGAVPVAWDVSGLQAKQRPGSRWIRTGPFGSSLKGEHWVEDGHPVITIGSLGEGTFYEDELLFVGDSDAARLQEFQLKVGDVVFSRVADVGRSAVVRECNAGWIMSSNLMRIAIDSSVARPDYLQMLLAGDSRVKAQIRAKVNSGGREVANSEILSQLQFAWPGPDEQDLIVSRVMAADAPLQAGRDQLRKLRKQKLGLMQDLFTGKVRVPMPETEPSAA